MLRLFAKQEVDIETSVENSISGPMSVTQTFKIMAVREGAYSRKIMRFGVKVCEFEHWVAIYYLWTFGEITTFSVKWD